MKRNRSLLLVLALVMAFAPMALNAVSEAGVIFLLIEPSSRANALGGAYTAMVDDAFAGYWNTGALAFNRKTQVAFMHTNWLGDVDGINDMYIEYLGYNQYVEDLGNVGFNITYLTYGEQTRTDEDGKVKGTFESYELAVAATYGYQLTESLGVGVGFKYILSNLSDTGTGQTETDNKGQGMSFAFDLGIKSRGLYLEGFEIPNLDLGASLANIGPKITYINDSQSDKLPMNLRLGASYRALEDEFSKLAINGEMSKVLVTSDMDDIIYNGGIEYVYLNLIALRGGYIHDDAGSITGPSFGVGLQYDFDTDLRLKADFAMQEGGELTDYNKTFTVGLEF